MSRRNGHCAETLDEADYDLDGSPVAISDPWWLPMLEKNGKPKVEESPRQKQVFKLAPHHVLCQGCPKPLYNGDPANRVGLPVLMSPGGLPVARLHGDLKENEVSWVLR